jgi:hypothetical protein
MDDHVYRFKVITRSVTKTTMGMGVVVTVTVLVGEGDHLSMSGTLSMTEAEWLPLAAVLKQGLGDRAQFEEIFRR